MQFSAGQWLDTFVPGITKPGGFTITCAPSAVASASSSNPEHRPYLELAVQESTESPQATWLWRPKAEILGSTLQVRIGGSFVFPPTSSSSPPPPVGEAIGESLDETDSLRGIRRVVFVAGGVGINPLMSMLSYISESQYDLDIHVFYASKVPAGGINKILFLDRISAMFRDHKLKGQFNLFVTGNSGVDGASSDGETPIALGTNVQIRHGRMPAMDLLNVVKGSHRSSSLVYVCGPPAMTDEFVALLTAKDGAALDPEAVMLEKWW